MSTPAPGRVAPAFNLPDQHGAKIRLSSLKGRNVLVYFYPRADTPGCTTQACALRDIAGEIGDSLIIGISPDTPAEKYGVWVEKKNYGKVYMGVQRSAFLVGENGKIVQAWPKISPKDTPTNLLAALSALTAG